MVMSEPLSEKNFVDTGKKYPALYCSNCLADEFRVKQPKTAINPDTLDEYNIAEMPDEAAVAVEKQTKEEKEDEANY
jgi:serine protease inhibitor